MRADLSRIKRFLSEYGVRPDLSVRALMAIGPLFARLENEDYALMSPAAIDRVEAASILTDLVGSPVDVVEVRSLAAEFGPREGESDEACSARIDRLVNASASVDFPEYLELAFDLRVSEILREVVEEAFAEACEAFKALKVGEEQDPDREEVMAREIAEFLPSCPPTLATGLFEGPLTLAAAIVALAAVGDEKTMSRLTPALMLCYACLPLGPDPERPGTWIVFVD